MRQLKRRRHLALLLGLAVTLVLTSAGSASAGPTCIEINGQTVYCIE